MSDLNMPDPLVSVIIPCYNQGRYLQDSIHSVLSQSYRPVEVVVVDDGSTDNTPQIAGGFPDVKYVFQQNAGLSAARNTGIDHSRGDFLVFLDSDDWLLPKAIATNVNYLLANREAAFVSGSHKKIGPDGVIPETRSQITLPPYHQLLHQNYIGMIAAVMFRRFIFDQYRYDAALGSCEDYDLYLKITRDHPVVNHTQDIAAYRIHGSNMSGNVNRMLQDASNVLLRQKSNLRGKKEEKFLAAGLNNWKKYYYKKYYLQLSEAIAKNKRTQLSCFAVFGDRSSLYWQVLNASLYGQFVYAKIKRLLKGLFELRRNRNG